MVRADRQVLKRWGGRNGQLYRPMQESVPRTSCVRSVPVMRTKFFVIDWPLAQAATLEETPDRW